MAFKILLIQYNKVSHHTQYNGMSELLWMIHPKTGSLQDKSSEPNAVKEGMYQPLLGV